MSVNRRERAPARKPEDRYEDEPLPPDQQPPAAIDDPPVPGQPGPVDEEQEEPKKIV